MYDTIKIRVESDMDISGYLESPRQSCDMETGEISYLGKLKNFRIKQMPKLILFEGSLAVFHFNQNYDTLTRASTELALENLSDMTHLLLKNASVSRIDFGTNLLLKRPLINYFERFGVLSRFKKSDMFNGETISYKNTQQELIFYNKIDELRKKKIFIPDFLQGKNVLRYEMRYLRNLHRQLQRQKVFVSDLYDKDFFSKMVDRWESRYFSIIKNDILNSNYEISFENKSSFIKSLALVGYLALGGDKFIVKEFNNRKIKKFSKFTIRKSITEIKSIAISIDNDQVINELDEKVRQAAEMYRN